MNFKPAIKRIEALKNTFVSYDHEMTEEQKAYRKGAVDALKLAAETLDMMRVDENKRQRERYAASRAYDFKKVESGELGHEI